jgi:8-oxo-dGTP pyrophosphatase MutT (NUDIX family)
MFKASRLLWHITKPIPLGVRLLLVKEKSVLLVKHTYQSNYWFLVGGGLQRSEILMEAARREAKEEVGVNFGEFKNIYKAITLRM